MMIEKRAMVQPESIVGCRLLDNTWFDKKECLLCVELRRLGVALASRREAC